MITRMAGRDQKNDHSDGNATSKEIFRMITTLAGRDQKNDRSDGNTGSKEIFRMIAMVAMLDQKKSRPAARFYLVNLILVNSILLVFLVKTR